MDCELSSREKTSAAASKRASTDRIRTGDAVAPSSPTVTEWVPSRRGAASPGDSIATTTHPTATMAAKLELLGRPVALVAHMGWLMDRV